MAGRRDFRQHGIFSIDPATARDLDDALHISPVPGTPGHWHVGVHIADVAHFIPPYSALDYEAGLRSTSVYLVQRVIPMLPRLLCEELCSLNPGVDRFAFSIEWELDASGRVVKEWAGRSIIRSCAKLAYPMVQEMIDGVFQPEKCTAQLQDGATWEQVIGDCMALNALARTRRAARFDEGGALRLDGVKLTFTRDSDGNPVSAGQYRGAEANQLVEEFMLLANMQVAGLIADKLPALAMLRCHPPPNARKMLELQSVSDTNVLGLDCSSAGALQASLTKLREECEDRAQVELIIQMATKPMQLALYFCTGEQPDREQWRHYALAVPEYTHFTSPIRRYPDVVVHRLLAAALEAHPEATFSAPSYYAAGRPGTLLAPLTPPPTVPLTIAEATTQHKLFKTELTGKVAEHCNEKRLEARNAQDASLRLFLCLLLRKQPVVTEGILCSVLGDKFVGVYLPAYGLEIRVTIEHHAPFLGGHFDAAARTLVLQMGGPAAGGEASGGFNNASLPGRGFARNASGGMGSRNNSKGPEGGAGAQADYLSWMAALPSLTMEPGLQPAMLPLRLRLFDRVPVVISSTLRLGTISQVEGRLLLHPGQLADAARNGVLTSTSPQDVTALEALAAKIASAKVAKMGALADENAAAHTAISIPYEVLLND